MVVRVNIHNHVSAASIGLKSTVKPIFKILKTPIASAFLPSLLVFLSVMILRHTGSLESLELAAYDGCVALQPKIFPVSSRIVLVGITENDIRRQGKWPLSDAVLADLLKVLSRQNPRAIGVDIFRDLPVPPGQEDLDSTLVENPIIIAVMKFGEGGIPGPPILMEGAWIFLWCLLGGTLGYEHVRHGQFQCHPLSLDNRRHSYEIVLRGRTSNLLTWLALSNIRCRW